MKKAALFILLILTCTLAFNQKYFTKTGFVGFYSHTSMEDIKADNNQVSSILDTQTGDIVFSILNNAFIFDRALMQEHFNENYMESEKFPKSTFKGKIVDLSKVDFKKDGTYPVEIAGDLTIHGVTKSITTAGNLEVKGSQVIGTSKFKVTPQDYGIVIPSVVQEKIAKELDITVTMNYEPYSE
jgi:hypothetical protein